MTTKRYRAIIFDLDGTLIDNQASFTVAYRKLSKIYPQVLKSDSDVQRDELVSFYHVKDPREAFRRFCQKYGWDFPPSFEEYWSLWSSLYTGSAVPFSYSADTLSFLKSNGYRIGMITNGESHFQRAKLDSCGLLPYFDHVIVSGEVGVEKPNPQLYSLSAEALGVSLSECLFVGDRSETDIAGAHNAGMDSMLVGTRKNLLGATYHAENVSALKEILNAEKA